ncbi:MAG TPA: lysozyme inhibitor LprI family protein [Pyrinomonadaceae bacterium]|nr:lysozyme inhibitor LprI family protein [Pyrinomonadaceae bacterium]
MSKKFGAGVFALLLVLFCAGDRGLRAQQAAKPAAQATSAAAQETPAATAQDEQDDVDREDPCPGSNTQSELNGCAARARERADAELNRVYRQLMREAGGTERAKLRAAQLAWVKFRDAQCDYESVGNKGGSIYPMVYGFCQAKVTATRARQLREILREQAER